MFSQCLNPLFRTFFMMMLLLKWKAKKACIGKPIGRERERERKREKGKRRFCDQCCIVDGKEKSTEQYQESFSSDSQKILLLWTKSPKTS